MTPPRPKAFTLVQLVFVVFVMAVMLRVLMHDRPRVVPQRTYDSKHSLKYDSTRAHKLRGMTRTQPTTPQADAPVAGQVVEVVALSALEPHQGPLLARVIQQHRPATTEAQVSDLVDTLPPSAAPSVILILPSVEKPETPPDHDKCAPHYEAEADAAREDSPRC